MTTPSPTFPFDEIEDAMTPATRQLHDAIFAFYGALGLTSDTELGAKFFDEVMPFGSELLGDVFDTQEKLDAALSAMYLTWSIITNSERFFDNPDLMVIGPITSAMLALIDAGAQIYD